MNALPEPSPRFVWIDDAYRYCPQNHHEPTEPYAVLGLTTDATLDEVKQAYRHLVRRYHPDRVDPFMVPWTTEKVKHINRAYDTIKSQHARNL